MGKLTVLLHDTTLIDFKFLYKLFKRYRFTAILIPSIVFVLIVIYFVMLPDLFQISVGLKNTGQQANTNINSVVSALGENSSQLSAAEVIGLVDTLDFKRKVAKRIYENNSFKTMQFGNLKVSNRIEGQEIIDRCQGGEECILEYLTDALGSYYELSSDAKIDTRFYLSVKSFSTETTNFLLEVLSDLVIKERTENIQHRVREQINMTSELIAQKRVELNDFNLDKTIEQQSFLSKQVEESERRVREFSVLYNDQKMKLSETEIRLDQTDITVSDKMSADGQEIFKRVFNLTNKIEQLQQDIQIMELSNESASQSDLKVVEILKEELMAKKKELSSIPDVQSYLKNVEKFLQATDAKSASDKFNYQVMKKQFDKVKTEYEKALKTNQELVANKLQIDKNIDKLKPSFDYLKLLETKAVQLKLLEATIVPDMAFDKYHSKMVVLKRTSLLKLSLFALILSIIVMFLFIVIRYVFDDRIYDEEEIKLILSDIEIIGQTPKFD